MKDLFESILDDMDDIMGNAETDAVKKEAGIGWLKSHDMGSFAARVTEKDGKTYFENQFGELTITKKDKVIPDYVPFVKICRKFYVNGWAGDELPQNIVPEAVEVVMIVNCPNLRKLPQLPEKVNVFSVVNCPKITSLEGCPQEVTDTFKVVDCGKRFEWKHIQRACKKVDKQNAIY